MCGICGMYAPASVDRDILRKMSDSLQHRGPDDEGFFVDPVVGLGSRRLSIIDLAQGKMPISNEDDSIHVIQNGEIYNFRELRQELEGKGHLFRTATDTEAIVHLYEEEGDSFVEKLNGMFAIAIWDSRRQKLLLARDRTGQKPLYYEWDGKHLYFASEIKALREVPGRSWNLDGLALDHYFSHLYIPDPLSIYQEVRKLPPGHLLTIKDQEISVRRYWDVNFEEVDRSSSEEELVEELHDTLRNAVRRRLISDVPLGAFLSGGVDSATVVGLMSQLSSTPVKTFSIGFDEETFDELKYARLAAAAFGTDHHEEILRPKAVQLVEALVGSLDEPFGDSSAVPTWMVSQMARQHVTVALSGDGGDESFAGYQSHAIHMRDEQFHQRVPGALRSLATAGAQAAAQMTGNTKLYRTAGALRRAQQSLPSRYSNVFDQVARKRLFSRQGLACIGDARAEALFATYASAQEFPDFLSRVLYIDTKTYLASDILAKVDRMSMAHSLEVRSPLLDYHVLELAARIPSQLKLHDGVSKYILKKVAERFVPKEIVYRKKQGFGVPIAAWLRHDLNKMLRERLLSNDEGARLFNRPYVEWMLEQHTAGKRDWSTPLWTLMMFRMWQQRFSDAA